MLVHVCGTMSQETPLLGTPHPPLVVSAGPHVEVAMDHIARMEVGHARSSIPQQPQHIHLHPTTNSSSSSATVSRAQ